MKLLPEIHNPRIFRPEFRIYISGPIEERPFKNRPSFMKAESYLLDKYPKT